jgi:cytochrome c
VVNKLVVWTGLALVSTSLPAAGAAGDPSKGAEAFRPCAMCHSVQPGRHLTGPSLAHVYGRKAGTAEGYNRYSDPLQRSGIVWDAKSLDRWIADPQGHIPGNKMAFPGIRDAGTRNNIVAYIKAVSEGKAPAAPRGGGMMGGEPANLKQADAASQVVSMHHCRDTYIIKTAAGATEKVWEYNVRLKTDSSADGPNPRKPVMTGSGMRGDRVSVIFAAPGEISAFVKESCD